MNSKFGCNDGSNVNQFHMAINSKFGSNKFQEISYGNESNEFQATRNNMTSEEAYLDESESSVINSNGKYQLLSSDNDQSLSL